MMCLKVDTYELLKNARRISCLEQMSTSDLRIRIRVKESGSSVSLGTSSEFDILNRVLLGAHNLLDSDDGTLGETRLMLGVK